MNDSVEDFIEMADATLADAYAGVWIEPDQRIIHVATTAAHDVALRLPAFPSGWRAEISKVRYSRQQLLDIKDQVEARVLGVEGVLLIGLQSAQNRVHVEAKEVAMQALSGLVADFPPGSVHVARTNHEVAQGWPAC